MNKLLRRILSLYVWLSMMRLLSCQAKGKGKELKEQESGGGTAKPAEASPPQGRDHVIVVGSANGSRVFTPPTVDAAVGDTVTFEFQPKTHTVSQSFFEQPCVIASRDKAKGFHSGATPVKLNTKPSDLPRWTLQILVPTPIWFFCASPGHCSAGMVGAINAPKGGQQTFEKFQELAQSSGAKAGKAGIGAGERGATGSGPGGPENYVAGNGASARGQQGGTNELLVTGQGNSSSTGRKDPNSLASKASSGASVGLNKRILNLLIILGLTRIPLYFIQ